MGKAKAPAAHPKYSVMIPAAIAGLKDRSGSSRQAILKWIKANYKVEHPQAGQHLNMALKAGVKKGAGSFKLGEKPKVAKKAKKPKAAKKKAVKKPAKKAAKKVKKPAAKKAKKPAKKVAPKKKPAAKKAAKKPAKKAAPKKK